TPLAAMKGDHFPDPETCAVITAWFFKSITDSSDRLSAVSNHHSMLIAHSENLCMLWAALGLRKESPRKIRLNSPRKESLRKIGYQ
ncbi:hypothetical protein M8C21_020024, partial [Ambrosia artemisiifolia]